MELRSKKIFAREILFLLAAVSISALAYFCVYPYNSYYEKKANASPDSLVVNTKLADSLSSMYKTKKAQQDWFTNAYTSKFHLQNSENNRQKIWDHLQGLAQQNKINNEWHSLDGRVISFLHEVKMNNSAQFQYFLRKNIITDDDKKNNDEAANVLAHPETINPNRDFYQSKIFTADEQKDLAMKIFFGLLVLLFATRYVIYFVQWCLETLREKEA